MRVRCLMASFKNGRVSSNNTRCQPLVRNFEKRFIGSSFNIVSACALRRRSSAADIVGIIDEIHQEIDDPEKVVVVVVVSVVCFCYLVFVLPRTKKKEMEKKTHKMSFESTISCGIEENNMSMLNWIHLHTLRWTMAASFPMDQRDISPVSLQDVWGRELARFLKKFWTQYSIYLFFTYRGGFTGKFWNRVSIYIFFFVLRLDISLWANKITGDVFPFTFIAKKAHIS